MRQNFGLLFEAAGRNPRSSGAQFNRLKFWVLVANVGPQEFVQILGDYTLLLNRLLLIISPAAERKGAKVGIMADLKAVVDCAAVETA